MIKVLIVEGSKYSRIVLKKAIEENGHFVMGETESTLDAIAKSRVLKPDCIIIDAEILGKTGTDFIKKVKLEDQKIKIIVLSEFSDKKEVLESIVMGVDGFIQKPLIHKNIEKVLSTVNNI